MATLTIRQLSENTHAQLRARAAEHNRSVEAEVRYILDTEMSRPKVNMLVALHQTLEDSGGVELDIPARTDFPREVDL